MKTKVIIFALLLFAGFISCKKDIDPTEANRKKLLGKWDCISRILIKNINGAIDTTNNYLAGDFIEFFDDGGGQ